MAREGLDALLVYSYKNNAIRYLTDYSPSYSVTNSALLVLPLKKEPVIFTRLPGHLEEARRASSVKDVRVSVSTASDVASLDQMVKDASLVLKDDGKLSRIGLVGYPPELGIMEPLKKGFRGVMIVNANHIVDELRMIKSSAELHIVRKAAEVADKGFSAALESMSKRETEHDAYAAAESVMKKLGAIGSYCLFGACKGDISYMRPSTDRIRDGHAYFLETIPEYEGYWPERLSSVAVGQVSGGFLTLFSQAERLYEEVTGAIRPGITIAELIGATRRLVEDLGLKGLQIRLGHGIGLDNIERPEYFSDTDQTEIKPGMVFAIHPIIHVPGVAAAHLGGVVIITKSGIDSVSRIEPKIPII